MPKQSDENAPNVSDLPPSSEPEVVQSRIQFINLGHAEYWLKVCRKILEENIVSSEEARLVLQRTRNAFCRGFGYGSYDELQLLLKQRRMRRDAQQPAEQSLRALSKGFSLALNVAHECGFSHKGSAEELSNRLAQAAAQLLLEEHRGTIEGVVRDPSGVGCRSARVEIKCLDRVYVRSLFTGADGRYIASRLQPGAYELTICIPGFATYAHQVQVTKGSRTIIDAVEPISEQSASTDIDRQPSKDFTTVDERRKTVQSVFAPTTSKRLR